MQTVRRHTRCKDRLTSRSWSFITSRAAAHERCGFRACGWHLALGTGHLAGAQDTPLLSGGVGFFTNTPGGNTSAYPVSNPSPPCRRPAPAHRIARGAARNLVPQRSREDRPHALHWLTYLQGDYVASPHLTAVVGKLSVCPSAPTTSACRRFGSAISRMALSSPAWACSPLAPASADSCAATRFPARSTPSTTQRGFPRGVRTRRSAPNAPLAGAPVLSP